MPRESNMSHNIYILHSELSYTWMTLPLGRVTLFHPPPPPPPPPPFPEKSHSVVHTNQVHNSDEGCNGHVRYCCNLASVVLCKLSQLNLSETTGLNGTKLFWRTNHRIKKYINGLRIDSAIFWLHFHVDKFSLSFTVSEILLTGRDQKNTNFKTLTHFNFKIKKIWLWTKN